MTHAELVYQQQSRRRQRVKYSNSYDSTYAQQTQSFYPMDPNYYQYMYQGQKQQLQQAPNMTSLQQQSYLHQSGYEDHTR